MFERQRIERAVDLQQRSYRALEWLTEAIDRGFITPRAAHSFSTVPDATYAWLDEHYASLPSHAQPAREDLRAFANLFTTFVDNTFDLVVGEPLKRLYSRDNHCFCPVCSWLIALPRLLPKKLTRHDKERARKLTISAARQLALDIDLSLDDAAAASIADETDMREPLALVAYGYDLFRRLDGVAEGAASLALWRRFAWTAQGSPKQGFKLTASLILDGEAAAIARLQRAL